MEKLHLISFDLCPYAQRARIVLNEKKIDYDVTYIELSNKPDWFLKISPTGKVPLLLVGDYPLFESNAICEYINELSSDSLFPRETLERARCRSWIEFGSSLLSKIAGLYNEKEEAQFKERLKQIKLDLKKVDNQLIGPYFSGEKFGIADATYATIFRYFEVFRNYYGINLLESQKKLKDWQELILKRPSVIKATEPSYNSKLDIFLKNRNSFISSIKIN